MNRFEGKSVMITGGGTGIGKAAAILFAREGAKVTIAARRASMGEAVVEYILSEGGTAMFVQCDVAKAEDCRNAVGAIVNAYGSLDVAFNNAGIDQIGKTVVELDEEEWDRVIAVDLKGVFLCMKYQIPEMIAAGGGSIINTSSVAGLIASPGMAAYHAAKHGLIGLTKVAALECARQNIRVNAICPGGTHSELFDKWLLIPGLADQIRAAHPLGRFAEPEEPARAVLFLASSAASFITGVALPVDGGVVVA